MPIPPSLSRAQWPLRPLLTASVTSLALAIVLRHLLRKKGAYATLFGDPTKVARRVRGPTDQYDFDEYDVVIVGGGTAGCVLAARLSEDPTIRVLLLEAGASSIKNPFAIIPASYSRLFHTEADWNMFTAQTSADAQPKYWPRAKLLGGCTCMNAMIFQCGAPEDYDEWVILQKGQEGASGWAYKDFEHYFKKFETYNPSPDHPEVNMAHRGHNGPVQTGLFSHTGEATSNFIEACTKNRIPHVSDVNTHTGTMGVTKVLTYMTPNARRVTTQFAYLTAEVLARPNLKVVTHAHVTRILFDKSGPTTRAVGVEFTQPNGDKFQVKAKKEVVVSAGAVHTPHILMLSGVGPADHLAKHDIPVVADLPGVGSHLMDHPVIDMNFLDKTKTSLKALRGETLQEKLALMKILLQYKLTASGPLTTNVAEAIGFVRSTDPVIFPLSQYPPGEVEDTTSGPGAPDIEVFVSPVGYQQHGIVRMRRDHYFAMHAVLLRPKSRGTIRLKSSNPHDLPEIDPKYLSHTNDIAILLRAVRLLGRVAQTEPIASMIDHAGDSDPALDHRIHELDDAALAQLIRRKVETLYHPTSSARMAPLKDGGVVDPFLRVHGIPNLRVADASVFPTLVSGHTTAPTLAVAEKAADMIKAALSSKTKA